MNCPLCATSNQKEFLSEINIHFRDSESLAHRNVLIFPNVLVCIGCGFTQFILPDSDLRLLRENAGCVGLKVA
jgi:uncharacterized protein (DUF2225 family)